ncbi:hypothetical protein LPICM02_230021 [Pseudolactococcus piscium]|nr:hypothetical protein LPICM02_230021 [Lactococcus piscium]
MKAMSNQGTSHNAYLKNLEYSLKT